MGPESPGVATTQTYEAKGSVRAGGEGRLDAHGLATPFDGTAGRLDELPGPADVLCAALCAWVLKNVERFSHMLPFAYESATGEGRGRARRAAAAHRANALRPPGRHRRAGGARRGRARPRISMRAPPVPAAHPP